MITIQWAIIPSTKSLDSDHWENITFFVFESLVRLINWCFAMKNISKTNTVEKQQFVLLSHESVEYNELLCNLT